MGWKNHLIYMAPCIQQIKGCMISNLVLKQRLKKAEQLALELNMDSINQPEIMASLIMDSTSLDELLSAEDYKLVSTYFDDSLGIPLKLFNKVHPMFTATLASSKDLGNEMDDALDLYFFKEAKKENKTVVGLEKLEEQVNAFKSIPVNKQAEGLVELIKHSYSSNSTHEGEELMTYYLKGDVDRMSRISQEMDEDDPEMQELFNNLFLVQRNRIMVERAIPEIHKTSTFIAVGAAHLGGPNGIIQLLRDKGYTVDPK